MRNKVYADLSGTSDDRPWIKRYDSHVPPKIQVPEVFIHDSLVRDTRDFPDRTGLIFFRNEFAYRDFNLLANKFAASLLDLGVKEGDRVAIHLPNIPQYPISLYGILKIGAASIGCSILYKPPELIHLLNDSGAETIISLDSSLPTIMEIRDKTKLRNIIITGLGDFMVSEKKRRELSAKPAVRTHHSYTKLIEREETPLPRIRGTPKNMPALIQYTGGTTGVPKGVVLSHYNIIANMTQVKSWTDLRDGEDLTLSVFPFFHQAGQIYLLLSVFMAATQILYPNPRDLAMAAQLVSEWKPTMIAAVPTWYIMLLRSPYAQKCDFSTVKVFISGAAPFPAEQIREFGRTVGKTLLEVYGLTEASPILTVNPFLGEKRVGSVGLPLPNTDIRLLDTETGEEVGVGQTGELAAMGPQIMMGYWNKPDETARTLRGGWLYTGDIATMDEDGYFYIVDRTKDMINVAGYKVFPREVDEVTATHEAVSMAATVGIPDPDRPGSEIVKSFVMLKRGYEPSEGLKKDIVKFLKAKLASYKVPRILEFKNELPLTLVGKVLKRELRENQ
jgi:long-chain acyl-CoA synthetase